MGPVLGRIGAAILIAAFAFGAGVLVSALRGWGSPAVEVEVANRSGKPVRAVALAYESCDRRGRIDAGGLAPDTSVRLQFHVCGEAVALQAELSDGTVLRGTDGYAERGDRHTVTIGPDGIR